MKTLLHNRGQKMNTPLIPDLDELFLIQKTSLLEIGMTTSNSIELSPEFFQRFFCDCTPKQAYCLWRHLSFPSITHKNHKIGSFWTSVQNSSNVFERSVNALEVNILGDLPPRFQSFVYLSSNANRAIAISHHLFKPKNKKLLVEFLVYLRDNHM
jgi:hypothetical protein